MSLSLTGVPSSTWQIRKITMGGGRIGWGGEKPENAFSTSPDVDFGTPLKEPGGFQEYIQARWTDANRKSSQVRILTFLRRERNRQALSFEYSPTFPTALMKVSRVLVSRTFLRYSWDQWDLLLALNVSLSYFSFFFPLLFFPFLLSLFFFQFAARIELDRG